VKELKHILYEKKDGVAEITMNRPEVLNSIDYEVLYELEAVLDDLYADAGLRAAIITGAGKAFVAGADIAAMRDFPAAKGREFNLFGQQLLNRLEGCPFPVIAAVNGFALGGGLELAMACDIRMASSRAKMGLPEVKLGIFPGYGGTQRLSRLTNVGIAKYYIFTGEIFTAARAYEMGVVQEVLEPEQLMERARALAAQIAANSPVGVRMAKRAINHGLEVGQTNAIAFDSEAYATVFATQDRVRGMTAFLKKAPPAFENN